MLQMLYMMELAQIIGAIALIGIGVGIILYTLLRKSPSLPTEAEPTAAPAEPDSAEDLASEETEETAEAAPTEDKE